jgi:Peptidogalycan biosysnthesis/recognition
MSSIYTRDNLAFAWPRPQRFLSRRSLPEEALRPSAAYAVTFVNSAAEIPDELWATFSPPLEGRWLYEALEQSDLDAQFNFLYARISKNGVPVAVAPAFVMDVPIQRVTPEALLKPLRIMARLLPSILYQRTLFLGCPCSTEGTVGILPCAGRRAVLLALQDALEEKARKLHAELIVWKDMPESISSDLDWLTKRRRLLRAVSLPATLVKFSSQRKSDYFGQLKGTRRFALKKKLKLSAAEADISVQILENPMPDVLDEIFWLFRQTYLKSKTKFEELNRTWFSKVAGLSTTYFVVLREKQTGAMIACMTCFVCGSRLINKHVGFDYEKPKSWMLYFRLWDAVVDWALAKGFTSIHSGQTTYRAKIEMGHDLIPLVNYIRHRNVLLHSIYGRIVRTFDWAKLDEGLALFLKAHPTAAPTASSAPEQHPSRPVPPCRYTSFEL